MDKESGEAPKSVMIGLEEVGDLWERRLRPIDHNIFTSRGYGRKGQTWKRKVEKSD